MTKPVFTFPTRLAMNKGVVGPDFPGCINSGHAPALLKSKNAATYIGKPFMVGGAFAVKYSQTDCILAAMRGKRTEEMKRFKVRFFKTYAAAKKYFLKLMEPISAQREEARAAVQALKAAKPGTPEYMSALLNANDYGIIS